MNAKFIEIALANISSRRYAIASQIKSLERIDATPVTIRDLMSGSNAAQAAVISQLEQLRNDLNTLADPILENWLLDLGFVYGEKMQISIIGNKLACSYKSIESGPSPTGTAIVNKTVHNRCELEAMHIHGTITELRLDQYRRSLTMVLNQARVDHIRGGRTEPQSFEIDERIYYNVHGKYRSPLVLSAKDDSYIHVELPIRHVDREGTIVISKATA